MDAFSKSELIYWWGPVPAMRSWNEERIRRRFADPSTHQFKVVDDVNGTIVAWAKWDPPPRMTGLREGFVLYDGAGESISASRGNVDTDDGNGDGKKEADGKTSAKTYALGPPEGSDTILFQKFFDGLTSMEKQYQASEKLVLTHLCSRHSYHGRGIGAALLRSALDLADKEGVPAYLESARLAAPLYQRHGFAIVDTLEYDHTKAGFESPAILHVMVREPRVT
ncbi:hypothetical protein HD806DRAFT_197318 [Xylariaceae sp. AK1471]|nr:hypothetical protein HD806DRAFT_197318 [Xylariaceae sp. AK1471]